MNRRVHVSVEIMQILCKYMALHSFANNKVYKYDIIGLWLTIYRTCVALACVIQCMSNGYIYVLCFVAIPHIAYILQKKLQNCPICGSYKNVLTNSYSKNLNFYKYSKVSSLCI